MNRIRFVVIAVLILVVFAGGCRKKKGLSQTDLENRVSAREVSLFFEGPESLLTVEKRTLNLPEKEAAALSAVVRELIAGSKNQSIPKLFPAGVQLRATYLLPDGTAIVDLGGQPFVDGWTTGSHEEMIAAYSVVQTLTENFPSVRRVRFILNGEPAETLAGHIAIDRSLRPVSWLLKNSPTSAR